MNAHPDFEVAIVLERFAELDGASSRGIWIVGKNESDTGPG